MLKYLLNRYYNTSIYNRRLMILQEHLFIHILILEQTVHDVAMQVFVVMMPPVGNYYDYSIKAQLFHFRPTKVRFVLEINPTKRQYINRISAVTFRPNKCTRLPLSTQ